MVILCIEAIGQTCVDGGIGLFGPITAVRISTPSYSSFDPSLFFFTVVLKYCSCSWIRTMAVTLCCCSFSKFGCMLMRVLLMFCTTFLSVVVVRLPYKRPWGDTLNVIVQCGRRWTTGKETIVPFLYCRGLRFGGCIHCV